MSAERRPSIQQIAEIVGVSKATVSRALRGLPGQSEDTKRKILEAAKELGYTRHPLIAALMSDLRFKKSAGFSPVVALIHCLPWDKPLAPNMILMRDEAVVQAEKLGYSIEEFFLNEPGMSAERILGILEARGIRGIIWEHFWDSDVELDIDLSNFACVAINFTLKSPNLHRIVIDQFTAVIMAIENLKRLGYKRYGLAIPSLNESFTQFKREAALHVVHQSMPESERIPMFVLDDIDKEGEFENWIQTYKPDAILTIHPEIIDRLEMMGLRVPDDIAFAQLRWHKADTNFGGIKPNWEQTGIAAVNQVVDQLNRNEFGVPEKPLVTLVEGEWIDGSSVPPKA